LSEIVPVQLPDGQQIWARVTGSGGPQDVGFASRTKALVAQEFKRTVQAVVDNLHGALDQYNADEVSIDFGIELSVQSGQVLSVLSEAGATASVTVHLTWKKPAT
jgi:hypothetical protein